MNYAAHYDRLIQRARNRVLDGYVERHHVVPQCMGGGNEKANIVRLTAEEHYVAHQLLVKMYPGVKGLAVAAGLMAQKCNGNKMYGWLRCRFAMATAEFRRGTTASDETKAKMSITHIGKKHSVETRAKMSAREFSDEHRSRIAASNRGRSYSTETLTKMSEANLGKVASVETRAKMSVTRTGKKQTAEHIANSAAARTGAKRSQEARGKMSIAQRSRDPATRHNLNAVRREQMEIA